MARTFHISIPHKGQSQLRFPDRCICCGAPRQTESILQVERVVGQGTRQARISAKYSVPHCERCART